MPYKFLESPRDSWTDAEFAMLKRTFLSLVLENKSLKEAAVQQVPADRIVKAHAVLQQFKQQWGRFQFSPRLSKDTVEAMSAALGPIVNLDAVGGLLDIGLVKLGGQS